jgi:ribosomal protein L11 methyltransferase
MKYFEVRFHIDPQSEPALDLVSSMSAEAGFESFTTDTQGLTGYVQQQLFDQGKLDAILSDFPMHDTHITYEVAEAEDRDWNETWEKESFTPIRIGDRCLVHSDTDHLNEHTEYDIIIHPQLAFGTGHHQTTQMLLERLMEETLTDCTAVDAGCGSGILSIMASQRGAKHVFAYDIDRWSVENTTENLKLNKIKNVDVYEGDAKLMDGSTKYNFVIANINRNILMADLPSFVQSLLPNGILYLSGFNASDVPDLTARATSLGLRAAGEWDKDEWHCLKFILK